MKTEIHCIHKTKDIYSRESAVDKNDVNSVE